MTTTPPIIHGCTITPINHDDAIKLINGAPPEGVSWLLAHSYGGVTWGRKESGCWSFASEAFPGLVPKIDAKDLLELRMFGESTECHLWREGDTLRGRRCDDGPGAGDHNLRPDTEYRPLLGDREIGAARDGFIHLGTKSGRHQVVPLLGSANREWDTAPYFLKVVHYFRQDDAGLAQVAFGRLAGLVDTPAKEKK